MRMVEFEDFALVGVIPPLRRGLLFTASSFPGMRHRLIQIGDQHQ